MDHLVAIEAKCAYQDPEADEFSTKSLKSAKVSAAKVRKTQRQVNELLGMGFDWVVLLDIIANPPASGSGIEAWLRAAQMADQSRQAMSPYLGKRLWSQSPAGHWVWSAGAVLGKPESSSGAGRPLKYREAVRNPALGTSKGRIGRAELNSNLRKEFEGLPAPRTLQAVFDDCPMCGRIHRSAHHVVIA